MRERRPQATRGACELIDQLLEKQIRLIIVTSSSRDLILQDLAALDLAEKFERIYGYEQSTFFKPNPKVLDTPIETLAESGRIVYVGDSIRDWHVAKNRTDVQFVATLTGLDQRNDFVTDGVPEDQVVNDLAELLHQR
jgi:HAD superfamily hydrolase (TIGR01549 family)